MKRMLTLEAQHEGSGIGDPQFLRVNLQGKGLQRCQQRKGRLRVIFRDASLRHCHASTMSVMEVFAGKKAI